MVSIGVSIFFGSKFLPCSSQDASGHIFNLFARTSYVCRVFNHCHQQQSTQITPVARYCPVLPGGRDRLRTWTTASSGKSSVGELRENARLQRGQGCRGQGHKGNKAKSTKQKTKPNKIKQDFDHINSISKPVQKPFKKPIQQSLIQQKPSKAFS